VDSKISLDNQTRHRDGIVGSYGNSKINAYLRAPTSTNLTYITKGYKVTPASSVLLDPPVNGFNVPVSVNPAWEIGGAFIRVDVAPGSDPSYVMAVRCRYMKVSWPEFPNPKNGPPSYPSELAPNAKQTLLVLVPPEQRTLVPPQDTGITAPGGAFPK